MRSSILIFETGDFSDVFRDFIDQCLLKESKDRPTANELLRHPFLEGCADQLLQSERDRKYQRQKDLNNVDGNTDGEEEDEGKYFKAKESEHRVYGSTVV